MSDLLTGFPMGAEDHPADAAGTPTDASPLPAGRPPRPAGTVLWFIRRFDQTMGIYSNPQAAAAHGRHAIAAHFQHVMDRNRVPDSHRHIDWRMSCCGHLYGPGPFDNIAFPHQHAAGCSTHTPRSAVLRPFWSATGRPVGTGHVSTYWEISQGTAQDQFDPAMTL